MPFNHCPDRLTNRSQEVNKVLSHLKLKNKGILMTLQSSQKSTARSLTAELRRHLLRKNKHRAKLLAAGAILLRSLVPHGRGRQMYSALPNLEFLVLVLLLAHCSPPFTAQCHCRSCSAQHSTLPCHPFHLLRTSP